MCELVGGGVEIDVEAGSTVVLEVVYEGRAEGGLSKIISCALDIVMRQNEVPCPPQLGPL